VGQIALEDGAEVVRAVVIALAIELALQRLYNVLLFEGSAVERVPRCRRTLSDPGQGVRLDNLHGQEVQDLPRSARHVSIAGHADRQGRDLFGYAITANGLAHARDRFFHLGQVMVLVRVAQILEGIGYTLPRRALPKRPQRLDHARQPCMAAKEDQPPALVVDHSLIINKGAPELHQPAQHRHVVWLALDHVRKKHVGSAGAEERGGDLLDCKHDGTMRQVFLDDSAVLLILGCAKHPNGGRLNICPDAVLLPKITSSGRRHRHASLPAALVLATNTNAVLHAILLDGLVWRHFITRMAGARK